jgi:hypothetical protein
VKKALSDKRAAREPFWGIAPRDRPAVHRDCAE